MDGWFDEMRSLELQIQATPDPAQRKFLQQRLKAVDEKYMTEPEIEKRFEPRIVDASIPYQELLADFGAVLWLGDFQAYGDALAEKMTASLAGTKAKEAELLIQASRDRGFTTDVPVMGWNEIMERVPRKSHPHFLLNPARSYLGALIRRQPELLDDKARLFVLPAVRLDCKRSDGACPSGS